MFHGEFMGGNYLRAFERSELDRNDSFTPLVLKYKMENGEGMA